MESPIAQHTYIFPAQEFIPCTLRRQSRACYKPCFQDDPQDILESNTALLLADSFQNTCSTPLQKWLTLLLVYQTHGLSQEQAVDPHVHFIHHRCPKSVPAKSDSLAETEEDYFSYSGSKFFFRHANVKYFLRVQFQQIPNLNSLFKINSFYCYIKIKPNSLKIPHS